MSDVCPGTGTAVGTWCRGGVGNSHQSALQTKTLIHHILGPVHSGFEPELEFPEREPQKILWLYI